MSGEKVRAHVYISGEVQGIGFRGFLERLANSKGITGWVRNLDDGRVEAIFEGDEEKVKYVLERCHRGPPFSKVNEIKINWEPYKSEFSSFEIMR